VTRTRNRGDRRVVEVGISDKGLAHVRGLDAHVQRLPKALLGHLGAERLRQLRSLLDAVISDLGTFP
jgi:DNA-binding MarR family transcriptional regulator